MNRFNDETLSTKVIESVIAAEGLLSASSAMINEVASRNNWKYNSGAGMDIFTALIKRREPITVHLYTPWNPFTKAVGYFDGKAIYINSRKLPGLKHEDLVGLLLHEYSHYCGFTHGNNYKTDEKCKYSVPYYLSENVGKWL